MPDIDDPMVDGLVREMLFDSLVDRIDRSGENYIRGERAGIGAAQFINNTHWARCARWLCSLPLEQPRFTAAHAQ